MTNRQAGEPDPAIMVSATKAAELRHLGRLEEAMEIVRGIVERAPDWKQARVELAGILMDLGQRGEALTQLMAASALAPFEPGLFEAIARILRATGDTIRLASAAERLMVSDPTRPDTAVMAIRDLAMHARGRRAVGGWFRRLEMMTETGGRARARLLSLYTELDRHEAAVALGTHDLLRSPADANTANRIAISRLGQVMTDEALIWSRRASVLAPTDRVVAVTRAQIAIRALKWREAEDVLQPFAKSSQVDIDVAFWLGRAIRGQGRIAEADALLDIAGRHPGYAAMTEILRLGAVPDDFRPGRSKNDELE